VSLIRFSLVPLKISTLFTSIETKEFCKRLYTIAQLLYHCIPCNRMRGNGVKLKESTLRIDLRKKFYTMRVVKQWHRLPREVVDAPHLETFKVRLDGALRNLIEFKMSLLTAGGLG